MLQARAPVRTRAPWHLASTREEQPPASTSMEAPSSTALFGRGSGAIASFDPPDSVFTWPCEETCISVDGTITGFYLDANSTYHGFVRYPDGSFITIDDPAASTALLDGIAAFSINWFGAVTGE